VNAADKHLIKLGIDTHHYDSVIALAGNPNTGKSTVFNRLTGLRQHTGNWPGKTVSRAEGAYSYGGQHYKLIDLPGTYSLLSASPDEEVARDFILFGRPDVTVIVVDATRLERNLNLVLQVLEITDRVVICLNLTDEAKRHGLAIDADCLAADLGVPVVPTAARQGKGMEELLRTIDAMTTGQISGNPRRSVGTDPRLKETIDRLATPLQQTFPDLPNSRWVALRLLEGDSRIIQAVHSGEFAGEAPEGASAPLQAEEAEDLLKWTSALRWRLGTDFHDTLMESVYTEATRLTDRATHRVEAPRFDLDRNLDRLLTGRWLGFPLMFLLLAGVFWLTIEGANYPSALLASLLIDTLHPALKELTTSLLPQWLAGLLIDGIYLAAAWVVSVMLPPMAIFFPLFTLLEDFGYLPRVAFNLDHLFRCAGAHGKQALTLSMGLGCNAAGIIACRIIDSPRERLIAILTNNFALCNGRWPTQILLASIFIGVLAPAPLAGLAAAAAVVGITLLGILITFLASWSLSRTVLKGQASTFSLELPPYRPPRFFQTLYTSLVDRTLFVLWRAIVFAAPAGAAIWLVANIHIGDSSLAGRLADLFDPFAVLVGLNGIILLAYIIAIPANEIVIPTVLMLTVANAGLSGVGEGTGVMFELESVTATGDILRAGGWTLSTAICTMLFSLLHNPCSTTLYTIYKETGSVRWTAIATLLPLSMGFVLCFLVAQVWLAAS
jgi:ferrous iron transport protein B